MSATSKKRTSRRPPKTSVPGDPVVSFLRDLDREGLLKAIGRPGRAQLKKLVHQHFSPIAAPSTRAVAVGGARAHRRPRTGHPSRGAEVLHLEGSGIPAPSQGELPHVGAEDVAKLVTGPGMLTSDEMAERLGVSRETINQWRKAGKIIAVSGARRGLRLPAWQIGSRGKPYAAIEAILRAFGGDHWAAWRFLEGVVPELGELGHKALAAGREKELLEVLTARSHGAFS